MIFGGEPVDPRGDMNQASATLFELVSRLQRFESRWRLGWGSATLRVGKTGDEDRKPEVAYGWPWVW